MKKISPMLATLIDEPFDKEGWIFEIKWDGYRALGSKENLISRGQKSFNQRFPTILDALKHLPGSFVLDGEIVLFDAKGRSDFQLLQNYYKRKEGTPYYCVFDLLSLNGKDLCDRPLIERKALLKKLVRGSKLIRYSNHIETKGKTLFRAVKKRGLEGIIAKKADSAYQFHRTRDWLKIKTKRRQEVVIGGFTAPRGSRQKLGALLVGVYKKGKLHYAGHVGGGFNQQTLKEVHAELRKVIAKKCPFEEEPHPNSPVTWVKPQLVCEVSFTEWTDEGKLRHPIFEGMRYDKSAKKVVRE